MVKKFLFLILVIVSCFCLFGFTDVDNAEPASETIVDLTDSRWTKCYWTFYGDMWDDWTAFGKFNVLIECDDGRFVVPDSEGYSIKVGYKLDEPDEDYVSYHFSDIGWVSAPLIYDSLNAIHICDIVGGSDVTNPSLIHFFNTWYYPYEYFYGLYIMDYDNMFYNKRDVFGVVKVSDNFNLTNLRTVNLNVNYDSPDSSLNSVSFGSYSFVHDVYVNNSFTDYLSDYTYIVLDDDCNYNYWQLVFLRNNSDQILPSFDVYPYDVVNELNGDIPLSGTYYIDSANFAPFTDSFGGHNGTLSIPIECEGRLYKGFDIRYNSSSGGYSIYLLAPSGFDYSDLFLASLSSNGTVVYHNLPFTFSSSSLFGANQVFYDWFTASTTPVSVDPVYGASTLSGIWQANSSLTYLDFTESVKFLVNGVWYNQINTEPGYGPPDFFKLDFSSYDFNGNLEYDIMAATWLWYEGDVFTFQSLTSSWSDGIIDFGMYDQIVGSDFYNWVLANFTYVGESSNAPPSDEELLGFFPRLFSTVQQALDSFVFYTTESGYNLTVWTFIVTILGISFIVWILKLIAGG